MSVNSFNASNPPLTTKGDLYGFSTVPTRVAVGANDTVLTADSSTATGLKWATAAAGGFTLLSTTTLATATTNITSINQTYNHLYVQMENYGLQTGNGQVSFQVNSTTGNQRNITYSNADATQSSSSDDMKLTQSRVVTINQNENVAAIWIYNYANTDTYKVLNWTSGWRDNSAGAYVVGFGNGLSSTTSAISSLAFVTNFGTFNGGTVKIYGVK